MWVSGSFRTCSRSQGGSEPAHSSSTSQGNTASSFTSQALFLSQRLVYYDIALGIYPLQTQLLGIKIGQEWAGQSIVHFPQKYPRTLMRREEKRTLITSRKGFLQTDPFWVLCAKVTVLILAERKPLIGWWCLYSLLVPIEKTMGIIVSSPVELIPSLG